MKNVGFNTLTLHNRLYLFFSHEISAGVEFNRDKGRELVKYLSNDLRSVSARHGLRRKRYFLRKCRRDVTLKGEIVRLKQIPDCFVQGSSQKRNLEKVFCKDDRRYIQ